MMDRVWLLVIYMIAINANYCFTIATDLEDVIATNVDDPFEGEWISLNVHYNSWTAILETLNSMWSAAL